MRAALYLRVSTTLGQTVENQRLDLVRYIEARGWTVFREDADEGVSGAKERRPQLDALLADARRRRFDVVVAWRLDRVGRNLRHLVVLLDELQSIGVGFVSLNEGIDLSTPAGRLQLHILAALAEFERSRTQERIRAGLQRVRLQGKRLGRPRVRVPHSDLQRVLGLSLREAAKQLGISRATAQRLLARHREMR